MRVVVLADFAEPGGGAQAVAIRSALSLADLGLNVSYVHATGNPIVGRLQAAGVELIGLGERDVWDLPALEGASRGIWNARAAARLRTVLSRWSGEPVVLHLHQWTRAFSPAILPVLLASGHPLAVTLHDYFLSCPNGVYYRFDREEPCALRPLSPACLAAPCDPRSGAHKLVRVLRTLATRLTLRGAAFDVVHVSDRGRDTLAPFLPATIRQHRIDNPVDIARREPVAIGPESRVAFVGRLTREKGADLVAAAARLADVPVLFVGDGPAAEEVRQLAPAAEILGWRSPAEVEHVLRSRVRAVAAPSRWYETGPLTVYEALATGLPAVASARSGAAERVSPGETGFVVEPQPEALATAFRALAEPGRASALGQEAYRRYWRDPMDPARHATALRELYREMLGR